MELQIPDLFQVTDFTGAIKREGEHIATVYFTPLEASAIAKQANEKLHKIAATWPRVYGYLEDDGYWSLSTDPKVPTRLQAKQGLLAFAQPMKRECVKHEPKYTYDGTDRNECKHCGIPLRHRWEAAE